MELDYIENVNGLEEHVVRLYNFNMAEAIQFRALLIETIMEKHNLILGLFASDEGILSRDQYTFYCILTLKGFANMIQLITPFCTKESRGYQYLYEIDNPIDLLFSPTASW